MFINITMLSRFQWLDQILLIWLSWTFVQVSSGSKFTIFGCKINIFSSTSDVFFSLPWFVGVFFLISIYHLMGMGICHGYLGVEEDEPT